MDDLLVAIIYADRPTECLSFGRQAPAEAAIARHRNAPGVIRCMLFETKRVAYPIVEDDDTPGTYTVHQQAQ